MKRLIDADSLLEKLKNYLLPHEYTELDEVRNAFVMNCMEEVELAPIINRWISVNEELPDKEGYYLVSLKHTESDSTDVDLLHYDDEDGFWFHDEMQKIYWKVTAWKLVPESYNQ